MEKLGGKDVEVDEGGYLVNKEDWNKDVAIDIAKGLNIELSDKHWEVIEYLREQHEQGVEMSIRKVGKSGIVDIKGLYTLFPGGPLKFSSRVAGLKKPTSCV